jgi:hypothetical protein
MSKARIKTPKFKAIEITTNDCVCGYYCECILCSNTEHVIDKNIAIGKITNDECGVSVYARSVCQLVDVIDGVEIYEYDIVRVCSEKDANGKWRHDNIIELSDVSLYWKVDWISLSFEHLSRLHIEVVGNRKFQIFEDKGGVK